MKKRQLYVIVFCLIQISWGSFAAFDVAADIDVAMINSFFRRETVKPVNVISDTEPQEGEADFDQVDPKDAEVLAVIAAEDAAEEEADAMGFIIEGLQNLIKKSGGADTPFISFLQSRLERSDDIVGLIVLDTKFAANEDPFLAFEGKVTNTTTEPVNARFGFLQGTLPIPVDVDLQFETFFTAEVTDTGGSPGASAESVFARYSRTLSDVTEPTEFNTVTSEINLDGTINLVSGTPHSESSGSQNTRRRSR